MISSSAPFADGMAHFRRGDMAAAGAAFAALTISEPSHADAWHLLGLTHIAQGRIAEGVAAIERALSLKPAARAASINLANAYVRLGRTAAALPLYQAALAQQPADPQTQFLLGVALQQERQLEAAIACFQAAIALSPDLGDAWLNLAATQIDAQRFEAGAATLEAYLARQPQDADAHCNLGIARMRLGDAVRAASHFERAIALRAEFHEAWLNWGTALRALDRFDDALRAWERAAVLNPAAAEPLQLIAEQLAANGSSDLALGYLQRAKALDPNGITLRASLAVCRQSLCDWSDLEQNAALVEDALAAAAAGKESMPPFTAIMLAHPIGNRELLALARAHAARFESLPSLAAQPRPPSSRLRLGYLSADFHDHATSHLIAGLLEHHDRGQFEVSAFSVGPDDGSDYRRRIEAAVEHFVDLRNLDDEHAAQAIAARHVDLLIDLKGYTLGARPGILARRPAPVQVHYLGYPGTLGAAFIDYLVADRRVVPATERAHFSERVVDLAHCYQCNDDRQRIAPDVGQRSDHGLPEKGFVYCCFNQHYKIEPQVFSLWMRILAAVPGSVLWLVRGAQGAMDNLRREAARCGIDPQRLVFADKQPKAGHLARHAHADLFLDTHFCNAHTTASDALWAGLPLLTWPGETFASRVAASLLAAVGLPDLVADSPDAYVNLAVALALEPERMADCRQRLTARATSPLFDTVAFTREFEQLCLSMARHETH